MAYENLYSDDGRQYLQMMQDNISRMSGKSGNCKNLMISLVVGMLALGCSIEELNGWIILALIPIFVFWHLDVFYLQLERKMRNRELDFILKSQKDNEEEYKKALFNFAPMKKEKLSIEEKSQGFVLTNNRMFSKSIASFYGGFLALVIVISVLINWECIILCLSCTK